MRRIEVFDTTLRDGEQAPGIHLPPEKKVRIARALEDVGVDIIETGFPANGKAEQEAIKQIARVVEEPQIAVLCRPIKGEIDLCEDLLSKAGCSRLHLWISTSPLHLEHKLNKTREEVVEMIAEGIRYASGRFDHIQFTSEDATRSHMDFLGEIMKEAVRAGADNVNVADTVGCALPANMNILVRQIRSFIRDRVPVGVHCHNDLGLATANTIAGIRAGASHIEVTVTGIGERAGNASLEQVAVALMFHRNNLCVETGIRTELLGDTCDIVIKEMGLRLAVHQPLIGENAFRHESGIHVHGMLNNPFTYELISPKDLGIPQGGFIIGRHTGRAAIQHFLHKVGYLIDDRDILRLTDMVKERTTYSGPFASEMELVEYARDSGFELKRIAGCLDG